MADVRALLAAERQSRRITHPHLTHTKSGALLCNVCNLNIKSEQLWPGHLKSVNHRKNVQKTPEAPSRSTKRKADSFEEDNVSERHFEVDSRKKPKPASNDNEQAAQQILASNVTDNLEGIDHVTIQAPTIHEHEPTPAPIPVSVPQRTETTSQHSVPNALANAVAEDEWAAFERDIAPLVAANYSIATIEAAPVSAAEMAEQQKTNPVQQREDETAAEIEDESRRMEEEFEVMEEMEDRVKRLRARREALRMNGTVNNHPIQERKEPAEPPTQQPDQEESSDDEDTDDWYG